MHRHPSTTPPEPLSRPTRLGNQLAGVALLIALMALAAEGLGLMSYRAAMDARQLVRQGRNGQALQRSTEGACRLAPYGQQARYTQLVALKNLGRWPELAEAAQATGRWHPDATLIRLIEGEAAWNAGRSEQSAQALWMALWQAPSPPHSAAALWLTTAWASESALMTDKNRLSAACQVLAHLEADAPREEPQRRRLLSETRELFMKAGLPDVAEALKARLDSPESQRTPLAPSH